MTRRRFVLVTGGSLGDTLPFIGLAKKLLAQDAAVLLAAAPEAEMLARIEHVPYQPVVSGGSQQPSIDTRPSRVVRTMLELTEQWVIDPLEKAVQQLDMIVRSGDVIVAHPIQVGAPLVAKKHGLPWLTVSPAAWLFPNAERMPLYVPRRSLGPGVNRLAWHLLGERLDRRFLGRIAVAARRLGLAEPPVSVLGLCSSPLGTLLLTSPLFLDSRRLPASVRATGHAHWDVTRLWRSRRAIERFLDAGDPPVVFRAPPYLPAGQFRAAAAAACQRLGVRGLLIDLSAEQVGEAGPLYVDRYVPLSVLAPRALAGVHYGGLGTSAAFAAAGVPAVMLPTYVDQFESAEVLRALGAAIRLDWHTLTPDRLSSALARCLQLSGTAHALGERLRGERGFDIAVTALLDLPDPA